ncbi:hypothetical protein KOR42_50360 [Thalassoglobus neptunius]|uniref:Uncharacterized protein n=1 Tax=Thalassoglobus neptunius TaxID=1938619 RepID=A0A5C5VQ23_9PLAN|nr:hypothetical protein KOR42_50360 [Thalassoglobus neptunius]
MQHRPFHERHQVRTCDQRSARPINAFNLHATHSPSPFSATLLPKMQTLFEFKFCQNRLAVLDIPEAMRGGGRRLGARYGHPAE